MCFATILGASAEDLAAHVERYVFFGFGPFAGRNENGSWQSVKQFGNGTQIRSIEVPVVWGSPRQKVADAVNGSGRLVLVGLGEGGGSYEVETVAFNERGNIRDESGNSPADKAIVAGGDARVEVSGRAKELATKLNAAGFPTRTSKDAGRFIFK
jgi:pyrrolidone-carboxylate peptidase